MYSGKDAKQKEKLKGNQHHIQLQKSRISLVALSQHRGVSVSSELTSNIVRPQLSFNTLTLGQPPLHPENEVRCETANTNCAYATGRELYAPTNSVLHVKVSSFSIDREKSINSFSSAVSPSVFHIIPELQRGQSSYHIDHGESLSGVTSGWYANFGDIDYLWSVIPSAESVTESVKAAVLETYCNTDTSLPTILQPRFKAKAPGTSLALWVPNIMASIAKRFSEENSGGDLSSGGDKSNDIVKQNIGFLLKKDLLSTNWPFKGTLKKQSDRPSLSDQQQRHRKKIDNHRARVKVKHLSGEDKLGRKHHTSKQQEHSTTMAKSPTWRGWRKSKIKYVEPENKDSYPTDGNGMEIENYDSTPMPRRRVGLPRKSQDVSSVDSGRSSTELPDYEDTDESMVFFNYSDDGSSYTCKISPLQTLSTNSSVQDVKLSRNHSSFSSVYSDDSDTEDEEELFEESFRLETEHVNCECIKYRDSHDEFPYLKTLEDIEKQPNYTIQTTKELKELDNEDIDKSTPVNTKSGGLKRHGSFRRMTTRQRRITDSGRLPKTSNEVIDDSVDLDPKQVQKMKVMRDKIEYIRVASQEDVKISAKLYIRIPERVHLCKIQTHLLLCAMRAFFTCNEGIQIRWVRSLHTKIYQLLERSNIKIKFSGDDGDNFAQNNDTLCLLLSYDASVLLRDRNSSLLVSVADILQVKPENILVLEMHKNMGPPKKKSRKSRKSKKTTSSSSELEESGIFDAQPEWFIPVFL